jgi:hypothetical protein
MLLQLILQTNFVLVYIIIRIEKFMNNARDIACQHHKQEKNAFSFCGTGLKRLYNGKRPGKPETKQHNNLKNTHNYL